MRCQVLVIGWPKTRSDYVTDLLFRQMQGAREHAINHNRKVTLCGIDATGKCIDKAFTKLVIFIDDNKNNIVDITTDPKTTEAVISETAFNTPRGSLKLNIAGGAVSFKPDGSSENTAAGLHFIAQKALAIHNYRRKFLLSNSE
ncbi:MAG: GspH/FimT family protein [Marinagarivorans sp.]|nr:GspH/FimT family protein [Marinagarivorans sp.]